MAARVTGKQVREVIKTDAKIATDPFISVANILTDDIADNDSGGILSAARLAKIELYLAAFFYAILDQQFAEKKTGGASARFQVGAQGKGFLEQNDWGKVAMALDVTGYLAQMNSPDKCVITHAWLGKALSDQIEYEDRD